MKLWDYQLPKKWRPKTNEAWIWYLERKINYDDWTSLTPRIIKKYFRRLKLDQGKRLMLKNYFAKYGAN